MSETDNDSQGQKRRTKTCPIIGLVLLIVAAVLTIIVVVPRLLPRRPHGSSSCGHTLSGLAKAMWFYAGDANDRLPTAHKWCDLLVAYDYVTQKQFLCDRSDAKEGECSYAINKNLENKKRSEIPGDVVLLFETNFGKDPAGRKGLLRDRGWYKILKAHHPSELKRYSASKKVYKLRWNQCGGPEILSTDNHNGEGCNIAFADGHIKFVRTEHLGKLKWKVAESK